MIVKRLLPLSGIVFVALVAAAFAGLSGSTPGIKASPEQVAAFYRAHHGRQSAAPIVLLLGVPFLIFFAASLSAALRPLQGTAPTVWRRIFFGGAVLAGGGFLVAGGIHLALADGAQHGLDPVALQALNALDADDFLAFGGGIAVMMLGAAGSMIGAPGALRWLGWAALVLGVLAFSPAGFFAFLGSGIWIAVVSVIVFMLPRPDGYAAVPAPAA